MKSLKKKIAVLLALALAVSLWGCASSKGSQNSTLPPETTELPRDSTFPEVTVDYEQVTDPDIHFTIGAEPFDPKPNISTGSDAQTAQLRIAAQDSAWQNAFNQDTGCYAVASGVQELSTIAASKLSGFDLDLSAYDDAFFAANRLVLIPRSSNTGSVTYQAKLNVDGDNVHIHLDGKMPEIGTADMAQWLVLVTLPNAEYGSMNITVPTAGGTVVTINK